MRPLRLVECFPVTAMHKDDEPKRIRLGTENVYPETVLVNITLERLEGYQLEDVCQKLLDRFESGNEPNWIEIVEFY